MLMKKSNKVLMGCLALLLVMAVGYALFSETITINGTATAKGEFKVEATCVTGVNPVLGTIADNYVGEENGYKNDSCTVSGDTVSYHADLEYPGAKRYFTLKITNTGTIDAVSSLMPELTKDKICLDGANGVANGVIEENECVDQIGGGSTSGLISATNSDYVRVVALEKPDGTILDPADENNDFSDFENPSNPLESMLKPGASLYMLVYIELDKTVSGKSIYATHELIHKLKFSQPTAN